MLEIAETQDPAFRRGPKISTGYNHCLAIKAFLESLAHKLPDSLNSKKSLLWELVLLEFLLNASADCY